MDFAPSEAQEKAINLCCDLSSKNRIVACTGQAGTGKTSILQHVYNELVYAGYSVSLCAPTGKASKRIKEATGINAKTIHRLLEYTHPGLPDENGNLTEISGPQRTITKPLHEDVILVDEAAMIASDLYRNLIDAMKSGSHIRFFGDANQLQPIEVKPKDKSSFMLLLENPTVNSVRLDEIYRQAEGSSITMNGQRIIKGQAPIPRPDFAIKSVTVPIAKLGDIARALRNEGQSSFEGLDHQIITPSRRSKVGTIVLNKLLADIYTDHEHDGIFLPRHKHEVKFTGEASLLVKIGDKVIVNSNIYDLRPSIDERYINDAYIQPMAHEQIYNGECGIVIDIANNAVTIDVGDRVVVIPEWLEIKTKTGLVTSIDPRKEIELAYAITTHKAQGSEYENVLVFLSSSGAFNQCRANYYTAVTRAKSVVCVVGDQRSLNHFSLRKEQSTWDKTR